MAAVGRPPILDEVKRGEIVAIVTLGLSRRTAAKYVGCSPSTISRTARRDPEFGRRLRQASRQAELGFMRNIRDAAKKPQYWRAAAWALERLNPEDFASRGPNVITVAQFADLIGEFAQIVVDEVANPRDRKAILKRLDQLLRRLSESSSDKHTRLKTSQPSPSADDQS